MPAGFFVPGREGRGIWQNAGVRERGKGVINKSVCRLQLRYAPGLKA